MSYFKSKKTGTYIYIENETTDRYGYLLASFVDASMGSFHIGPFKLTELYERVTGDEERAIRLIHKL